MSNQQLLKGLKLLYTRETVVINGYIIPCVAIIVLVTNTFVILVYKKQYQQMQNKIRKISSILYISIATSNSLAVLPTSIWYVYLFTFGNVASIVPYNLCYYPYNNDYEEHPFYGPLLDRNKGMSDNHKSLN
jgi:hypothetical protein